MRKVTVSIPKNLFRAVERARRKHGKSRSQVMQDALRRWLQQQPEALLLEQYVAGYLRMPELRSEGQEAEATAVQLLGAEVLGLR